jgi:hypothetical protein
VQRRPTAVGWNIPRFAHNVRMSYDLFFKARGGVMDWGAAERFFAGRARYKEGGLYENENTGVYFVIDINNNFEENRQMSLNLNYFRPHVFGLEAAPEIEAMVEALDLKVDDPQIQGMGMSAEFSREEFLRGWNEGNRVGYRAVLGREGGPGKVYTWSADKIERIWTWNYARETEQEKAGDDLFVPKISAIDVNGEAQTFAVWPAAQTLIPTVDWLFFPCAPDGPSRKDWTLIRWTEVLPFIERYRTVRNRTECYLLDFQELPSDIARFCWKRRPKVENLRGVPFDQILDSEIVNEELARRDSGRSV